MVSWLPVWRRNAEELYQCRVEVGIIERGPTLQRFIVHGRVPVQTVTALANLLRPPLPQDFPQNSFPVDVRSESSGSTGSDGSALERELR